MQPAAVDLGAPRGHRLCLGIASPCCPAPSIGLTSCSRASRPTGRKLGHRNGPSSCRSFVLERCQKNWSLRRSDVTPSNRTVRFACCRLCLGGIGGSRRGTQVDCEPAHRSTFWKESSRKLEIWFTGISHRPGLQAQWVQFVIDQTGRPPRSINPATMAQTPCFFAHCLPGFEPLTSVPSYTQHTCTVWAWGERVHTVLVSQRQSALLACHPGGLHDTLPKHVGELLKGPKSH